MNPILRIASLGLTVAMPWTAMAEPDRSHLRDLPVASLKTIYLGCNSVVLDGRLSTGSIAQCSVVYEELKQRGFDGDFYRFLAWSKAQPEAVRATDAQ
jgi:hypothetical protein